MLLGISLFSGAAFGFIYNLSRFDRGGWEVRFRTLGLKEFSAEGDGFLGSGLLPGSEVAETTFSELYSVKISVFVCFRMGKNTKVLPLFLVWLILLVHPLWIVFGNVEGWFFSCFPIYFIRYTFLLVLPKKGELKFIIVLYLQLSILFYDLVLLICFHSVESA